MGYTQNKNYIDKKDLEHFWVAEAINTKQDKALSNEVAEALSGDGAEVRTLDDALLRLNEKAGTGGGGEPGFSPTVEVTKTGKVTTVTITDKTGVHTATINDGADGQPGTNGQDGAKGDKGEDGVSPTISAVRVSNGVQLTITDKNGSHSAVLNDGIGDGISVATFADVPNDGKSYLRQNGTWVEGATKAELNAIGAKVGELVGGGDTPIENESVATGKYINSSGAIVDNASLKIVYYVVNGFDKIKVKLPSSITASGARCAFFDSLGNRTGTLYQSMSLFNETEIEVPSDAYRFGVSVMSNNVLSTISVIGEKEGIEDRVKRVESKANEIGDLSKLETSAKDNLVSALNEVKNEAGSKLIGDLSNLKTENKETVVDAVNEVYDKVGEGIGSYQDIAVASTIASKYVDTGGVVQTSTAFKIFVYDVSNVESIKIKLPANITQQSPYCAFFDSSNNKIGVAFASRNLHDETKITCPSNASFFYVSVLAATTANSVVFTGIERDSVVGKINKIINDQVDIIENVEKVNDVLGYSEEKVDSSVRGYYVGSNGKLQTIASEVYCRFIPLKKGDTTFTTIKNLTTSVLGGFTTSDLTGKTPQEIIAEDILFDKIANDSSDNYTYVAKQNGWFVITTRAGSVTTVTSRTKAEEIGDLTQLETENKEDLVSAINEVKENSGGAELVGNLSELETVDKSNVVNAINELKENQFTPSSSYVGKSTQEIVNEDGDTMLLGEELVVAEPTHGSGWTGSNADGYIYTPNQGGGTLAYNIGAVQDDIYLVSFSVTNTNQQGYSSVYVQLGGSYKFETYKGGGNRNIQYLITAGSTGILEFSAGTWEGGGKISNVSVKKLMNRLKELVRYRDSDNLSTLDLVIPKRDFHSFLLGSKNTRSFIGEGNVSLGSNAMNKILSGFWNTAIGYMALEKAENASRNIAIGYIALWHLINGDRNIAIGTFAMEGSVNCRNNIAIGADAMQGCNGDSNIGIGTRANIGVSTGERNVGIGGSSNASVGIGKANVSVGDSANEKNNGGNFNTSIGTNAHRNSTTGSNNTCVGGFAGQANNGSDNVMVGYQTSWSDATGNNNVVIGSGAKNGGFSNTIVLGKGAKATANNQVVLGNKLLNFNDDGSVTWTLVE